MMSIDNDVHVPCRNRKMVIVKKEQAGIPGPRAPSSYTPLLRLIYINAKASGNVLYKPGDCWAKAMR